jgi:hypothetical protein
MSNRVLLLLTTFKDVSGESYDTWYDWEQVKEILE